MTCTFASGEAGPLVVMYGSKGASQKTVSEFNERFAPEVVCCVNDKKSHMYDSQLYIWYLLLLYE